VAREPAAAKTAAHAGPKRRAGLPISPKIIIAAVITILAVWFILVNRGKVDITLWVSNITASLWLVLLLFFAGGLITGLLLQRNKRQQR
jgi:uncharacterized integral membrane protein